MRFQAYLGFRAQNAAVEVDIRIVDSILGVLAGAATTVQPFAGGNLSIVTQLDLVPAGVRTVTLEVAAVGGGIFIDALSDSSRQGATLIVDELAP